MCFCSCLMVIPSLSVCKLLAILGKFETPIKNFVLYQIKRDPGLLFGRIGKFLGLDKKGFLNNKLELR